jgi:hypothetical protein
LEWFGRLIAPRPLSVGRAHQTKSVSNIHTDIPDRQNQQRELEAVAERHGWNVVAIFTDAGISGTKARDKRPGYDRLCRGIARREFDQVTAGLSTGSVAHCRSWSRFLANCMPRGSISTCIHGGSWGELAKKYP